jgi:hypothetical protein
VTSEAELPDVFPGQLVAFARRSAEPVLIKAGAPGGFGALAQKTCRSGIDPESANAKGISSTPSTRLHRYLHMRMTRTIEH